MSAPRRPGGAPPALPSVPDLLTAFQRAGQQGVTAGQLAAAITPRTRSSAIASRMRSISRACSSRFALPPNTASWTSSPSRIPRPGGDALDRGAAEPADE